MKKHGKNLSEQVSEEIAKTIGWIAAFKRVTSFYDKYIDRIGKHLDCPLNHHGASGGKNCFRLFEDFDKTGFGICTKGTEGPLNLLMATGQFASYSDLLHTLCKLIEGNAVAVKTASVSKASERHVVRDDPRDLPEAKKRRYDKLMAAGKAAIRIEPNDTRSDPIKLYFRNRGIPIDQFVPECLKYHPGMEVFETIDGKTVSMGKVPVGLAAYTNLENTVFTFHRIFTNQYGYKPSTLMGKKTKRIMGEVDRGRYLNGSAMRAYTSVNSSILHVTEGLEKAHALRLVLGDTDSIWATYCANNLAAFNPPEWIDSVCIWADYDPIVQDRQGKHSGMEGLIAALKLRDRLILKGINVQIILPISHVPEQKIDWEDVIVHHQLLRLSEEERVGELPGFAFSKSAVVTMEARLMEYGLYNPATAPQGIFMQTA